MGGREPGCNPGIQSANPDKRCFQRGLEEILMAQLDVYKNPHPEYGRQGPPILYLPRFFLAGAMSRTPSLTLTSTSSPTSRRTLARRSLIIRNPWLFPHFCIFACIMSTSRNV